MQLFQLFPTKLSDIAISQHTTVQKVHHTVHPISIPQHHPAVTSVHHEPTAVLAKAPKISGFKFTSEVRHDAPISHGYSHGSSYGGHGGDAGYGGAALIGHGGDSYGHGHGAVITHAGGYSEGGHYGGHDSGHYGGHDSGHYGGHDSGHGYGHAPAPYVSSKSLSVAPAKIIETPAVSSYKLETGRIDTHTQQHYGTVHEPVITKVGYAPVAVSHSVSHGHGHGQGYGSHY